MIKNEVRVALLAAALSAVVPSAAGATNPPEIGKWCADLHHDLLSVNLERCNGRDWLNGGASMQGRPIPFTYWGNPNGRRVLVLGSVHGDEITSVSMLFRWMDFLDRTRKESFLRENYYLLAPLVNPDGYYIRPRTRVNASGVDLNRNFRSQLWAQQALLHWRSKTKSDLRRFPGKKAGSESETRLVEKWIEEFKPELIVTVHAPYGLIDHDGPVHFPKAGSPLPVKTVGSFPGSLGQYAGVEKKIPVVTVELGAAKKMPDQKTIEDILIFVMKAN